MASERFALAKQFLRYCVTWRPYAETHFSQEGEDLVLQRIFSSQLNGFYVDIGAHHPQRFSNTCWAYSRGWSGLNVDAAPGSNRRFRRSRPRDISIERGIAEAEGYLDFYVFPEGALNTSDSSRRGFIERITKTEGSVVRVYAEPLAKILSENIPPSIEVIDFMSIDIEGSDMAALRSNDWERFKPRVLVLEVLGRTLDDLDSSEEVAFLRAVGFVPVSMMCHSVIFISDQDLLAQWSASHIGGTDA